METTEKDILRGGQFLIKETKCEDIFTPEDFSEEQQMIKDAVIEFVDREIWPNKSRFEQKDYALTEECMRKAGELGFLGISVPEEYDGLGMGFVSAMLVCDYISGATGSFSTAFGAHTGIGTMPITLYGTEEQKKKARKKFDREEAKIKTKRAKEERRNAIIQIAIDTAIAVVKAVAASPTTGGLPFSAIALGIGIAQAAFVASQPLPKFEKGGTMRKEGMAITQERRPEPITDKYGRLKSWGSTGGDALTYLSKGDKVFKSREDFLNSHNVDQAIFNMNMQSNGELLSQSRVDNSLLMETIGLRGDIDKMGRRIEKMAKRPIQNNVKVELPDNTAY